MSDFEHWHDRKDLGCHWSVASILDIGLVWTHRYIPSERGLAPRLVE